MLAVHNGRAEVVLALLSRDDVNWTTVQDQLSHPSLQNINEEVSLLLAVVLPDEEPRNSIIARFNQRNQIAIQQDNNILGAGLDVYNNLNDISSWHARYLIHSGAEGEEKDLKNRMFLNLLENQDEWEKH